MRLLSIDGGTLCCRRSQSRAVGRDTVHSIVIYDQNLQSRRAKCVREACGRLSLQSQCKRSRGDAVVAPSLPEAQSKLSSDHVFSTARSVSQDAPHQNHKPHLRYFNRLIRNFTFGSCSYPESVTAAAPQPQSFASLPVLVCRWTLIFAAQHQIAT
jgi:hypothetical protein